MASTTAWHGDCPTLHDTRRWDRAEACAVSVCYSGRRQWENEPARLIVVREREVADRRRFNGDVRTRGVRAAQHKRWMASSK